MSRLAESQAGRSNGFHASTQGNPYPSGIVLFIGLNASSRASPLVALCLLRAVLWSPQGSNDIRFFAVGRWPERRFTCKGGGRCRATPTFTRRETSNTNTHKFVSRITFVLWKHTCFISLSVFSSGKGCACQGRYQPTCTRPHKTNAFLPKNAEPSPQKHDQTCNQTCNLGVGSFLIQMIDVVLGGSKNVRFDLLRMRWRRGSVVLALNSRPIRVVLASD